MKSKHTLSVLGLGAVCLLAYGWLHSEPRSSVTAAPGPSSIAFRPMGEGSTDTSERTGSANSRSSATAPPQTAAAGLERMARAGLSRGQSEEDATPGIAEAELAAGDWALAIQKLQASLSKRPENTDAWADLSLACLNRGGPQDLELALDAAERAIDLDPRCFAAWFNRACAHARLGHSQEALAALESAHALDAELVRTLAPQDPDLASVRDDPRFAALIGG